MISLCIIFILLSSNNWANGGCKHPQFKTDNGINFPGPVYQSKTMIIDPIDSVFFYIQSMSCGFVSDIDVFYNDKVIVEKGDAGFGNYFAKKIPCLPGHYKVKCKWSHGPSPEWNFNIEFNPKFNPVTVTPYYLDEKTYTEVEEPSYSLNFFPNPAKEFLNINCTADSLTDIKTFDNTGRLMDSFQLNNSDFNLPLEKYPPGIYIIQVSTLAHKPVIRKFSVL